MADGGYLVTEADIESMQYSNAKILNLDFSKHSSYTIDADIFYKFTNINIKGISSIDDFASNEYVLNIVGVENVELNFGPGQFQDPSSDMKKVMFNGSNEWGTFDNSLKNMSGVSQTTGDSQCNLGGMKFITNVVDATTVNVSGLSGHLVAPNADVSIGGGNFEGNVIAKSISSCSAEAHFYPYNRTKSYSDKTTESTETTEATTEDKTTEVTTTDKTTTEVTTNDKTSTEVTTTESTDTTSTQTTTTGKPNTGDNAPLKAVALIVILALAGSGAILIYKKKRYER